MIEAVIVHIIKDDKILLHYKKRGHGAGYWNGIGGKVEQGETPEECAVREAMEEMHAGIKNLKKLGILIFYDVYAEDWKVYVFRAEIEGEPKESEESKPKWFHINDIPYEQMWEDDKYWMPLVINELKFNGEFWFSGKKMLRFKLEAWTNDEKI